jgi:hypothetical protein
MMKAYIALLASLLSGCQFFGQPSTPDFELRDFVITEEKTEKTEYSKEWNTFKARGNVLARNIDPGRNVIVLLEIRDKTVGADAEPSISGVIVRGGLGKIEISKSKYGEVSKRPEYIWSVIGWYELQPSSIKVVNSTP